MISDVIAVLTDSKDPSEYIKDMRRRDNELSKGWGQIVPPLWIETPGGKQKVNCTNTEGIFRIIQRSLLRNKKFIVKTKKDRILPEIEK